MYTPNAHLDAAHQRLLRATSDEARAGAPVKRPNVPAQHYDAWQHLPQTPLPLYDNQHVAARRALSLRPDTNTSVSGHEFTHQQKLQPWQLNSVSWNIAPHFNDQYPSGPPLCNTGTLPNILQLDPQEFSSHSYNHQAPEPVEPNLTGLPYDFLPQTREYLASASSFFPTTGQPIAGTDGADGHYDGWALSGQPLSSSCTPMTAVWDQQQFESRPQIADYSDPFPSPQTSPTWQGSLAPHFALPDRAYSVASLPILFQNHGQLPSVQEWRTDNLPVVKKSSRELPDASTKRRQETHRRKGEARRKTIADGMAQTQTLASRPHDGGGCDMPKLSKPPRKRRKLAAKAAVNPGSASGLVSTVVPPQDDLLPGSGDHDVQPQKTIVDLTVIQVPLPNIDELPQAIVSRYEDYKWSVYRYELLPTRRYHHAEPFIRLLVESTLQSAYQDRHVLHVSQGFIQEGGPLSIIVLHNATNPFEYEPSPVSTVTIGVYGYHWYHHNEIHWITLASDQRLLFDQCVQADYLVQTHKWTFDNPKASERRFHRAYWLAANKLDLKGILNRGPSNDVAHDRIEEKGEEDPDEDFEVSKADLTNEWEVSDAEAAVAWQRVQDEVDGLDEGMDVGDAGWQHLVISNTEW